MKAKQAYERIADVDSLKVPVIDRQEYSIVST